MMFERGETSNVSSGHYTVIRLGNVELMQIKVPLTCDNVSLDHWGVSCVTGTFRRGARHVM